MPKIDESKLPLDLQCIILTGMTFQELSNFIATELCRDEEENERLSS